MKKQQGFTLIELMIVVAIVGILAAIAIPAYQDYIKRSKVSEVAAQLAACKTSVSEFYQARNDYPGSAVAAGCEDDAGTSNESAYMAQLVVVPATGTMQAQVQNIDALINGTNLEMRPCTEAEGGNAIAAAGCTQPVVVAGVTAPPIRSWRCFHANTNVHKWVPASCRNDG